VPYINRTYANRSIDDIGKKPQNEKDALKENSRAISIEHADVSEASGEDVEEFPKQPTANRDFLTETDQETHTFMGAALKSNIPIRGNTSGSAASTLSAIKRYS